MRSVARGARTSDWAAAGLWVCAKNLFWLQTHPMKFGILLYIVLASCLFESQIQQGTQAVRNGVQVLHDAGQAAIANIILFRDWAVRHLCRIRDAVKKASFEKAAKMPTKEELKEKARKIREHLKHLQETMLSDTPVEDKKDPSKEEKKKTRAL